MKKIIIIGMLVLIMGCSNNLSNDVEAVKDFNSFLEEANIEKTDEMYIYEGDVALSNEHVKELYNDYLSPESRGNYSNPYMKWKDNDRFNLTYQFTGKLQTSSLTEEEVRSAFRKATRNWMQVAGVKFIEVNSNPLFTVTGTLDFNADYYAISFFPYENTEGESKKVIKLNRWMAAHQYNTYDRMVGLFTHELGHALGLAHEHQRDDSPNTYKQGYYSYFKHGSYDENSIMNYRNKPYLSGISQGDIEAIQNLYPKPYIIVYEDANYKGRSLKLSSAHGWLSRSGWGYKISSIKCFGGAEVTLYSKYGYRGEAMTVLKDISFLGDYDFDNMTNSIGYMNTPREKFVIAYKDANFKGRAITITGDMSQLPLDNTMSSVELYNGLYARIYKDSNYRGASIFIGTAARYAYEYPGYTDLFWSKSFLDNFNDVASSIAMY